MIVTIRDEAQSLTDLQYPYPSSLGFYHSIRTLSLLLKYGADPHRQDDGGCTPLFLAVRGGHSSCAQTLLEHGAKVETLTKVSKSGVSESFRGFL